MNKHLQRFLNKKVAVRLRTQDEWTHFMEILERDTDVRWRYHRPTQLNRWNVFEEKTSVAFNFADDNALGYSRLGFYEDEGYEIVEFKDLLKEEKIMTLAEKLRFLADRVEDGKEFYLAGITTKFNSENKLLKNYNGEWVHSYHILNNIDYQDVELKPQWEFTEDEKVILRNLPDDYRWIARDGHDSDLFVYGSKPTKFNRHWSFVAGNAMMFTGFRHLFQSIQWSDEEACEFRKYI